MKKGKKMNNITVKERSKIKEFCKRIKSKMEDMLFLLLERLPERLLPSWLINWMSQYIDKRMAELEREQVKANWEKVYLEQAVKELRNK